MYIPGELKKLNRWIGYKLLPREGNKPEKKPINLVDGRHTWGDEKLQVSFSTARKNYKKFGCDGIGIVLHKPYVGIDVDKSLDLKTAKEFNSYSEYSPSNNGYHVIVKGEIPRALGNNKSGIEIYTEGRWFTVTGKKIPGFPLRINEANGNLKKFFEPKKQIEDLAVLQMLENIIPEDSYRGRTPTFVKVINILKSKGLGQDEVYKLLKDWAVKYNYEERIENLINDQYKRYPPPIILEDNEESYDIDSFLANQQEVDWLVPNLIAKNSIVFMAGLPETGKTWAVIDLAVELAKQSNGIWLSKFPVKKAKVLFIDQERFKGETQRRFKAVIQGKNLLATGIKDNLFIRCNTRTRLNLQHSFEAFKKVLNDIKPDVAIIDSFATFHTCEENNRKDIQSVLELVKRLRNEFNCTFIFIHHENKNAFNKGQDAEDPSIAHMAGNVAIPAVAETVFTVRKHGDFSSIVYNTKNTLSSTISPFIIKVIDMDEKKTKIKVEAS